MYGFGVTLSGVIHSFTGVIWAKLIPRRPPIWPDTQW
jgi:hypothetical protein